MSDRPERICPNADVVFAKVIDGEAVIMNIRSGIYYSMDQVGALVWTNVEEGASLEDIVAAIVGTYAVSAERARADVERLVQELLSEQIVRVADPSVAHARPAPSPPAAPSAARQAYTPPALTVYRDMGDLLALDPPAPDLKDLHWKA